METTQIVIDKIGISDLQTMIENVIDRKFTSFFQSKEKSKGDDDKLLTRKEVLRLLNIVPSTLYQWTRSGKIPFKKIGKRQYFKQSDLMNNIEGGAYGH